MNDLRRFRRAGGDALQLLVDLLPSEWDLRSGEEDVTVIFADISGYSDFVADHGDEAAIEVLGMLDEAVEEIVEPRKGAKVVKRLGDGLMIVTRRHHEGPAIAVGLVEAFGEQAHARGWPLRLRAGAHRGTCRRQGSDYFGYHVNLSARVAESAPGGRALSTPHALAGVDLRRLGLAAVPAGQLHAKGVVGPVDLFLVVSQAAQRQAS